MPTRQRQAGALCSQTQVAGGEWVWVWGNWGLASRGTLEGLWPAPSRPSLAFEAFSPLNSPLFPAPHQPSSPRGRPCRLDLGLRPALPRDRHPPPKKVSHRPPLDAPCVLMTISLTHPLHPSKPPEPSLCQALPCGNSNKNSAHSLAMDHFLEVCKCGYVNIFTLYAVSTLHEMSLLQRKKLGGIRAVQEHRDP